MRLSKLSEILATEFSGTDTNFEKISINSRTIQAGELFVAVKGEQFDGHDFIAAAVANGACAIVASKPISIDVPLILVDDTIAALGKMAKYKRQQHPIPTIALTGSCGKTTTKSMLAAILGCSATVNATKGSYNNHYGLPLTLFDTENDDQYLVLELGANHHGEIAYLTDIAQPDVALITNAAACHLEGFGSIAGVAKAKGEIFQGLPADGMAILNRDDDYYEFWQQLVGDKRQLSFGLHPAADVRATAIDIDPQGQSHFILHTPQGEIAIELPLLGEHNVLNALAATAACVALDIPLSTIKQGLEMATATTKRLVTKQAAVGAKIIDDTYNANPQSMLAAIHLLTQLPGEKILVMGDMGELGEQQEQFHFEVGQSAKQAGIDRLFAVGKLSAQAVKAFGEHGEHFADQQSLVKHLSTLLSAEQTVLVKGSRSAKMENVVEALVGKE